MKIEGQLRSKIQNELTPTYFELVNESHQHAGPGAETHFRLVVVSPVFEGMGRLERQRLVMNMTSQEREQGLHALTMRTMTPAEWESVQEGLVMESPACRGGSSHLGKGK